MTYSKLAKFVPAHSSNHSKGRAGHKISKITVHHMACVLTGEQCAGIFQRPARNASSNYSIGYDGSIACSVAEEDRAWTSSSYDNDNRAITIEVSNSATGGQWPVGDTAFEALVALCTDICKRYDFKLNYTGTKDGSLTRHNMFAATTCPGPSLQARFPELAKRVNANLEDKAKPEEVVVPSTTKHKVGEQVKTTILSAASNGTKTYKGSWSGKITKVIVGAKYPYLLNNGTGWTNDEGINGKAPAKPTPAPTKPTTTEYDVGTEITTKVLATSSMGGAVYSGNWSGKITKVVAGAKYPYLLNNGTGWTNQVSTAMSSATHDPCYDAYAGKSQSLDVILQDIGVPSSCYGNYVKRTKVAKANGINNYTGTASQNSDLIILAKKGKLKKV